MKIEDREARRSIQAVMVVVPAHDEELLLGRCLTSISRAVENLTAERPGLFATTVVVLDRCRDRSAEVADGFPVDVVRVDAGRVGVARAHGVRWAESTTRPAPANAVWIASTDADTVVPPTWLTQQVQTADLGADLVLGRVEPDPADLDHRIHAAWHRLHPTHAHVNPHVHPHVHGANLGIRLDAYHRTGGFAPVSQHEDAALVDSARRLGLTLTTGTTAVTSGRLNGRAGGGFSGYLRRLGREVIAVEAPSTT